MKKGSIFHSDFEEQINSLISVPHPVFREMELDANENFYPVVSRATGNVLRYLTHSAKPAAILEFGTSIGYSLNWMLQGHIPKHVCTLERNQKVLEKAKEYTRRILEKNTLEKISISFLNQEIEEYLEKNSEDLTQFEFIFLDCDKIFYPFVLKTIYETHQKNDSWRPIVAIDNVFWHGRIFQKELSSSPSDQSIQFVWDFVSRHNSDLSSTVFPCGDGLLVFDFQKK